MRDRKKESRNKALSVTFCGVMAALGAVIMIAGGFFGVLTYAAPLIASVFLIPVIHEFGSGRAWLAYLATAIVAGLLSPDKEEVLFYVFVGFYPIVRPFIQRVKRRFPRFLIKLGVFTFAIGAMYALICFVFKMEQVLADLDELGTALTVLFFAGLVLIMLVYDLVLRFADKLYAERLRPKLRFLG